VSAGKSQRQARIEGELQRVLAALISREVKDPRVGNVTVTEVKVAPDLSEARVYFVPFGDQHRPPEVLAGLTRAAGFLRGEVGRALSLRHAPRLEFVLDEQIERADQLSQLIDRAVKADHRSDDAESGAAKRSGSDEA
jgi:ribosome-binding factor A